MTDAFDSDGKVSNSSAGANCRDQCCGGRTAHASRPAIVGAARREAQGQAVVEGIPLPRRRDGAFIRTDVSSPGEVEGLGRSAEEQHGRVDILASATPACWRTELRCDTSIEALASGDRHQSRWRLLPGRVRHSRSSAAREVGPWLSLPLSWAWWERARGRCLLRCKGPFINMVRAISLDVASQGVVASIRSARDRSTHPVLRDWVASADNPKKNRAGRLETHPAQSIRAGRKEYQSSTILCAGAGQIHVRLGAGRRGGA